MRNLIGSACFSRFNYPRTPRLGFVVLAASSALLANTGQAAASVQLYQSQAAFIAGAPSTLSTQTFDQYIDFTPLGIGTIQIDSVFYEAAPDPIFGPGLWHGYLGQLGTNRIDDHVLSFGGGYVEAFGFDFVGIQPSTAVRMTVQERNGQQFTLNVAYQRRYLGFVSDVGITSISVANLNPNIRGRWDYDSVSRSQILGNSTLPIPETGTCTLLAGGLVPLVGFITRRKRTA